MPELLKPIDKPARSGCLRGCLITAVVIGAVILLGSLWLAYKAPRLRFISWRAFVENVVDLSSLPQPTKDGVRQAFADIDGLLGNDRDKLNKANAELEAVMSEEVLAGCIASFLQDRVIAPSALTQEEKTAAVAQVRRLYAAMVSRALSKNDFGEIYREFPKQENHMLKTEWSDEELRTVLAKIKAALDNASPTLQVADHYDYYSPMYKVIDKVFSMAGQGPASRPASQPTTAPASQAIGVPN